MSPGGDSFAMPARAAAISRLRELVWELETLNARIEQAHDQATNLRRRARRESELHPVATFPPAAVSPEAAWPRSLGRSGQSPASAGSSAPAPARQSRPDAHPPSAGALASAPSAPATRAEAPVPPAQADASLTEAAVSTPHAEVPAPAPLAIVPPCDAAAPQPRRARVRRGIHRPGRAGSVAIGAVALLGGALVLDAITTVVWQEPLTALQAAHRQRVLRGELAGVADRAHAIELRDRPKGPDAPAWTGRGPATDRSIAADRRAAADAAVNRDAHALQLAAHAGDPLGRLWIPRIGATTTFVQGTDADELSGGPGHYPSTAMPGRAGTVAIAGHRTTHGAPFRHIDALRVGDRIIVRMPYARVEYRVEGKRVVQPENVSALRSGGQRRLVLTACTPLYSAAQRLVVTARQVRITRRT